MSGEEVKSGEGGGGGGERVRSEDELGLKWDRCVADTIIKTGTGVGLGLVFSLLLFKRRPWPVTLGLGYGLGYAMANCQHDFTGLPSPHLRPVLTTPPAGGDTGKADAETPPTDSSH
ncbi:MICOS complex subunit Mic10 [Geodia barretti]|uniref:MICOS complex subunit MIC10 n=1 Tax=Geodia barretti TaxID=519541 RepID=A0AA35WSZ0_GEOBA|nr:MICOS complex subunit Mic10 [Geodia barretti]